nr:hypothetical protein [uncultured Fretibacterium sp.]
MSRLIVIEGHEGQRRQLAEQLAALSEKGFALAGKLEAGTAFRDWKELFASAGARGLFEARTVTVAEGAEALGPFPDELASILEGSLENDPEGGGAESVVVATFAGDTRKIFSRETLALKRILFLKAEASVPPWKRKDWLLGLARERGCRLNPAAAALLGESLESQEELRSELDKLSFYASGREIGVDDVRALSFDEGAKALLQFLDGLCQARHGEVVRSLRHLRSDPSPLRLLAALGNRLRPALYLACFPEDEAAALRASGGPRDHAVRMSRLALGNFGAEAIKRFMLGAAGLSWREKTSAAGGWPDFELLLWELLRHASSKGPGQKPNRPTSRYGRR